MAMYPVGRVEGERVYFEVQDYTDDWGIKRTMCEFVKRRPDGTRVRIPVMPPIKVTTYSRDQFLPSDQTVDVSPEEARRMFRDLYQTIAHA